jgi:hypothetical protein
VQTTQGPPAARSDLSAGTQALVGRWADDVPSLATPPWANVSRQSRIVVDRKAAGGTNEYGGTVLFEPFGEDGRSLGKCLRALLVAPCKP